MSNKLEASEAAKEQL